jgi:hypothetical protein
MHLTSCRFWVTRSAKPTSRFERPQTTNIWRTTTRRGHASALEFSFFFLTPMRAADCLERRFKSADRLRNGAVRLCRLSDFVSAQFATSPILAHLVRRIQYSDGHKRCTLGLSGHAGGHLPSDETQHVREGSVRLPWFCGRDSTTP